MKNFKHSIIAIIAVAMISSLAAAQADDFKDSRIEREQRINAATTSNSITIAQKDITNVVKGTAEISAEPQTDSIEDVIAESEMAAKSFYPIGYTITSDATLDVMESPSDEAAVIDSVEVCTEVEIIERSEGWYKILYNGNSGYVPSTSITQDRASADVAKKKLTNYRIAQIELEGDSVRVRKEANTDSEVITTLDDDTYVYILWGEDDFVRICYGDEYEEGYVINTSLQFTGEWIEKDTISKKQREIQEAKEAAAREAARAEEIARRNAAAAGNSTREANTTQSVAPASSSKGQAIVDTAMQYLGVPYVWGGSSPSGFDCSGLVQYVCRANGISVNRVAADQRNNGTYVSRENLQPGDLVFFAKNGGNIHHVGIYVGNGNMIHAPQTGDVVKISSINTEYRIAQYAGAVRVY
ncbi:MAG: C40 family peptidase [Oscillospiraceae bacterium]|nr:C40 family peptidase [Oscillospiraceae bacterium]